MKKNIINLFEKKAILQQSKSNLLYYLPFHLGRVTTEIFLFLGHSRCRARDPFARRCTCRGSRLWRGIFHQPFSSEATKPQSSHSTHRTPSNINSLLAYFLYTIINFRNLLLPIQDQQWTTSNTRSTLNYFQYKINIKLLPIQDEH